MCDCSSQQLAKRNVWQGPYLMLGVAIRRCEYTFYLAFANSNSSANSKGCKCNEKNCGNARSFGLIMYELFRYVIKSFYPMELLLSIKNFVKARMCQFNRFPMLLIVWRSKVFSNGKTPIVFTVNRSSTATAGKKTSWGATFPNCHIFVIEDSNFKKTVVSQFQERANMFLIPYVKSD